ncbi:MAG: hypothetical protein Kow0032_27980 [Methyloligellaceae bacterium]
MARVFLISLVLLFLPFIGYALWWKFVRAADTEEEDDIAMLSEAPIVLLMLAGVALAVAGLIVLVYSTGLAY